MFFKKETSINLNLTFDLDFLNEESNLLIFENDEVLVDKKNIKSFLNSFSKNSKVNEMIRNDKGVFSLAIQKTYKKSNSQLIKKSSYKNILSSRRSPKELIAPFVVKENYPDLEKIKNYQQIGINWLKNSKNKILADDMGLGKSLQAIMASSSLITNKEISTVLIICPSTLVMNWCNELSKWAPFFSTAAIIDTGNHKDDIWKKLFGYNHFVVTNYEQMREKPKIFEEINLDLIIADEAHKVRKSSSKIYQSIIDLNYDNFWALTGTPIEKNKEDACHILKLVDPKRNLVSDLKLTESSLRSQLRGYLLRRLKKEVLKEIMDFDELDYSLELTSSQKKAYSKVLKKRSDPKFNGMTIFNELREICDYDKTSNTSSKIDFIMELLEKIKNSNEKCVIFSFWLEPLHELKKRISSLYGRSSSLLFTGELNKEEREMHKKMFDENDESFVFLCSGKIGGEGINLTNANHAIFFNRWWNPSNNDQARDRIIRIGQTKKAFIYTITASETIEEEISKLLKAKRNINENVIEKLVLNQ